MTPRELRVALAAADEKAVRAAVRACGDALAGDDVGIDRSGLGEALLVLLDHPVGEVRQELAEMCDRLPAATFERVIEVLSADSDVYVRNAAERAAARGAGKKQRRASDEQRAQALEGLLDAIQSKDGKAARRRAEAAVRRGVEQFVLRLDHELRKTHGTTERALAALRAEIDKEDASRALMRRYAATLEEQLAFTQAIVRRGREYARQINGVFAREPIAAIVAEAKRQLLNRLGERAARVDFVAEIDPELEAEVDRHALLQALQNVLQNAVEAYGAERARLPLRVTARTLRAKSQLELRVADEGVGMLEEERVRMFVPFGSSKSGGTGVGMLVTRKMIEEVHGGELSIESAAGAGTTVTMVVPTRQRGER